MQASRLESILQALPAGYLLLDRQRIVELVTPTFALSGMALPCAGDTLAQLSLPAEVMHACEAKRSTRIQLARAQFLLEWQVTPLPDESLLISVREDKLAFRNLVDNSPDIITRYDLELRCQFVNQTLQKYAGDDYASHLGKTPEQRGLPWQIVDALRYNAAQVIATRQAQRFVSELSLPQLHRVFESRLLPEFENGELVSLLSIDRDISDFHAIRMWESDENRLLEMIANNRPLKEVMLWTCQMIESQVSGSICVVMQTGLDGKLHMAAAPSLDDNYHAHLLDIIPGSDSPPCAQVAASNQPIYTSASGLAAPTSRVRPDNNLPAFAWSQPISDHDHCILGTLDLYLPICMTADSHEQHIMQRTAHLLAIAIQQTHRSAELVRLATMDSLTGLPNRRHFLEQAAEQWQNARLQGKTVSLLMIDLDHFKNINDSLGHEAGDIALQSFAECLRATLRSDDLLCRMGGEEFAALLLDTPGEEALQVANRVCKATARLKPKLGEEEIRFTVSIGVAANLREHRNIGDLIRHADHALYQAKHEGRNRCTLKK